MASTVDNYRAHGETFASTNVSGVQTPIVHIDTVISDVTLDPTNLALEAGNLATIVGTKLAMSPGVCVPLSFNNTAAQSAAITASIVELCASAVCHILIGSNPTATANSTYLPGNVVVRYSITPGSKISAIQSSTAGTLYITPGS